MSKNAKLATAIAQAILSVLDAQSDGDSPAPKSGKVQRVQPAKLSANKPSPRAQSQAVDEVNPDLVEITVGTGSDHRIKLPKRMFDKNNIAWVDGTKYQGSSGDGGRCKVQSSVFGADAGDTIRIMREAPRSNKWTSVVEGAAKSRKVQPKAEKITTKVAIKPKTVKDNTAALNELVAVTAKQAIAGYNAGRNNENLPEGDARRFLTSKQKKAFNVQTNALHVKLADAVVKLNAEVFE